MTDHAERTAFFEELLQCLLTVVPKNPDIKEHVSFIRASIEKHKEGDKFARALAEFNDTEIEKLVRFVERPRGRHHIHEIKKLEEDYSVEQAGRKLLEHFYDHNKSQLIHGRKLKLAFH